MLTSMATPYYLGLDFGTSGARACVMAEHGQIEEFTRLDFGQLAAHELAPSWRSALFELLANLPKGLRARLNGIAIDGTSATILACDEALQPSLPPLLYNDSRADIEATRIARAAQPQHPAAMASSGLAKALWLQRHLAAERTRLILNQADWLTALLSDLPGITDYHNALKLGFDVEQHLWPDWVAYLIDIDSLPNPVPPGSPIGLLARPRARELGISIDCRVHAGTTDSIAAFLAAGASRIGDAVTSLGSTLVIKLLSAKRVDDARLGVYSHWFGERWLAGGASNAGGAVLRAHFSDSELTELSRQIDPDSESGLDYYPLPGTGERFPINDPTLPPRLAPRPAEPARFLHGLLEGLARIEAEGYRKLADLGAPYPVRVISTGGGAQNPTHRQIRAKQLAVPVLTATHQDAAFGTARLARFGPSLFVGHHD